MTVFGMIVLGIVVLCAGVLTSRTVAEMQLMRDAESHARRWTTVITSQPTELKKIFDDHRVDSSVRRILETATRFTQVISYELYDEHNRLFYSAAASDWNPKETTQQVLGDPITRNNMAQHRPSTRLHEIKSEVGKMNYAAVVLPVHDIDRHLGSVVAYVDQTDKAASIKSSLNVIALSTAGLLLLALGLPTIIILGRKRAHDQAEDKVRYLSDHDTLTSLPNRSAFNAKLEETLAGATEEQRRLAVLIFDIHRFKEINDSLGHSRADEFLKTVAAVIDDRLPDNAYAARLGSDEFAVMLPHSGDMDEVMKFAKSICAAVAQASSQIWVGLNCSLNCGGAISPDHATDRQDLLRYADLALQAAKTEGAGRPRLFERGMDVAFMRKREREQDLRRAIEAGEFHMAYQPLVDATTGAFCGHEALIRWNHPVHGKISPAYFITLAEETGLIVPLGEWALRTVCAEAARFPQPLKVAVNLSPLQFAEGKVAEHVASVLEDTQFDPRRLEVEITENVLLDNT
ncbi:MAG: putative bifunctional diguanylate cyclase/phosphodiesterase, partial [Hyphomicrobiales bacterium]